MAGVTSDLRLTSQSGKKIGVRTVCFFVHDANKINKRATYLKY